MLFWVLWASLAASIKNENKIVENLTWMPISRQKNISLIPALAFENLRCFGFVWQCQSTLRKKKKKKNTEINLLFLWMSIHTQKISSLHLNSFWRYFSESSFWNAFSNPEHLDYVYLKHLNLTMPIWNTWTNLLLSRLSYHI